MSANGMTKPLFVEKGAKINSNYYVEKVLKPFIKSSKDLYPRRDYIFHQDSAPAHTASNTLKFLRENKIRYIKPVEWLPNSPDAVPCDFFLWDYLKSRLKQKNVKTIKGLKMAISVEVKKIPLYLIHKSLKAWPKRLRQILNYNVYYSKGHNIEN